MLINVLDYPNLQAAVDAATDGDRVYLPAVFTYSAPFGGLKITKSLELFGDGPGLSSDGLVSTNTTGTTIVPANETDDAIVVDATSLAIASIFIHDLKVKVTTPSTAGNHGIRFITGTHEIGAVRVERVNVLDIGGAVLAKNGIHVEGSGAGSIGMVAIVASGIRGCGGLGLLLKNVRHARVVNSHLNGNKGGGARCEQSGVAFYAAGLDDNASDAGATQGQLFFTNAHIARVDGCHFEHFDKVAGSDARRIACDIDASGGGAVLGGNNMGLSDPPAVDSTGIRVRASGNGPVTILPNHFKRVKNMVVVDTGAAACVVLPQFDDERTTGAPSTGEITLPGPPNAGLVGCPSIRRIDQPNADALRGLLVPSGPTDPTVGVMDGMFFFNTASGVLRARIGGAWKTVKTLP